MMKVAITLDTDSKNQNNGNWEIQRLDFSYMAELDAFYRMAKRHGLPVTTFIRIDEQIAHNMGDGLHVYRDVERIARESGCRHEFGWHPHLFRLEETSKGKSLAWRQIIDEDEMVAQLRRTFEKYQEVVGPMKGVRVGAAQGGPKVLQALHDMGFQYDSSCLAGCKRQDANRWYDWSRSPNRAFLPSKADHQVDGGEPIGIREVPITTFSSIANYDMSPNRRAMNPAYHHYIFKNALDAFWANSLNQKLMVVAFHGDELHRYHEDHLFSYGLPNFWTNLTYLEKSLFDRKVRHSFHLMSEL